MPKAKSEGVKSYAKDRNEDFEKFKATFRGYANPEDQKSDDDAKDDKSDDSDTRRDLKKTLSTENGEKFHRIRDIGSLKGGLGSLFLRNIGNTTVQGQFEIENLKKIEVEYVNNKDICYR